MHTDFRQQTVGFIGGGNMSQAIVRGLLAAGHAGSHIHIAEPAAAQRKAIGQFAPEIHLTGDNRTVAATAAVLVLAVKPQIMQQVTKELAQAGRPTDQLIISVAAGITLASLQQWLGSDRHVVRVMPNTPALVGAGMAGLCANSKVDEQGKQLADYVMTATGKVVWFDDESLLDAVTAVSGSGPAYFFLVMEMLQQVAEELGIPAETARLLSTQTALGAAQVAAIDPESLAQLRQRVTSPGGTTEAAIKVMEQQDLRGTFRAALLAAHERSVELGRQAETH